VPNSLRLPISSSRYGHSVSALDFLRLITGEYQNEKPFLLTKFGKLQSKKAQEKKSTYDCSRQTLKHIFDKILPELPAEDRDQVAINKRSRSDNINIQHSVETIIFGRKNHGMRFDLKIKVSQFL
jgi:hypothetical protein